MSEVLVIAAIGFVGGLRRAAAGVSTSRIAIDRKSRVTIERR